MFENLPGGVFYDLVRVFLSIELTLTFPIVFKPASDVAEEIWYNFLMVRPDDIIITYTSISLLVIMHPTSVCFVLSLCRCSYVLGD